MANPNQDIRDYMADRGVTQRALAAQIGITQTKVCVAMKTELSQKEKEEWLRHIDAIATDRIESADEEQAYDDFEFENEEEITTVSATKFRLGDRVKIPSKSNNIGIVNDIWSSLAKSTLMYTVENECDGFVGMYNGDQLELAPLPIEYTFGTNIDGNVAVVTMIATQGEKSWIYARGHAHIIHDGEVGMAQAISYAAKRMFEAIDKKQQSQIYCKEVK